MKLLQQGTNLGPFRARMLPPLENSVDRKDMLIARSRERFATPGAVVDDKLDQWMAGASRLDGAPQLG